MKERLLTLFLILILIGGIFSCRKGNFKGTGGNCVYADEPVTILVKKIEKQKLSVDAEILIISYEMTYDGGGQTGNTESGEIGVKPVEAKAKAIEIGKKFHASVSRLVSGTCNPEPRYPELKDWK